jgi:hypothetical protein
MEFLAAPHDFMAKMHQDFPPIFYDVTDFGNAWLLLEQRADFRRAGSTSRRAARTRDPPRRAVRHDDPKSPPSARA